MTNAIDIIVVDSSAPIPSIDGSLHLWRALRGGPPFRRIIHVVHGEIPDLTELRSLGTVWTGHQIFGPRTAAPNHARGLRAHLQDPPKEHFDEFEAWLMTEHSVALADVPGVFMAARYAAVECIPARLGLYYLSEPAIHDSAEWKKAVTTPWSERMRGKARQVSGLFATD